MCDDILCSPGSFERPVIHEECMKKVTLIGGNICMRCGKQLDDEESEYCMDCTRKNFVYKRGVAAFAYSDVMKKSMYAFKYNNRREYAGFYSGVLWKNFGQTIKSWNAQALVPVPLHKSRQRKRGYNQAQVLAQKLSEYTGIPVDAGVLFRIKSTVPQKTLTDRDRFNNIENAFQIGPQGVKYNCIILVDDIYTTGATINECASVLISAGAKNVYFVAACIGRGF